MLIDVSFLVTLSWSVPVFSECFDFEVVKGDENRFVFSLDFCCSLECQLLTFASVCKKQRCGEHFQAFQFYDD